MKFIAIYITNKATVYGGAQSLRRVVLLVFMGQTFTWEQGRKLVGGTLNNTNSIAIVLSMIAFSP